MKQQALILIVCVATLGVGCSSSQVLTPQPTTTGTVQSGTTIDLSGRGLTSIPSEVFRRTEIEKLNLSQNRLTGAPPSQIGQLVNLKELDLSGNALTGLPAELGRLSALEVLDVSQNALTGLPMELGNLTHLRVFDISGNRYSQQDLDAIAAKLPNTEIRR